MASSVFVAIGCFPLIVPDVLRNYKGKTTNRQMTYQPFDSYDVTVLAAEHMPSHNFKLKLYIGSYFAVHKI